MESNLIRLVDVSQDITEWISSQAFEGSSRETWDDALTQEEVTNSGKVAKFVSLRCLYASI